MTGRELLKLIKCNNQIANIKSCELISSNKTEDCYKLVTELGELDCRIIRLKDGTVSKLDYFDTRYTFDRNVNLQEPLPQ